VTTHRWILTEELLEWHGSAMISRIVWEFVEGFLERISLALVEGGRAFQSVTVLGRNENLWASMRDDITVNVSVPQYIGCWSSFTGIAARPCRPL